MNSRQLLSGMMILFLLALASPAWSKEAKTEFKVSGMTCEACGKGVEAQLAKLPGVKSATVSFKEGTATVVYDDTKVTLDELKKTIEKSGFKAESKKGNSKGCCP